MHQLEGADTRQPGRWRFRRPLTCATTMMRVARVALKRPDTSVASPPRSLPRPLHCVHRCVEGDSGFEPPPAGGPRYLAQGRMRPARKRGASLGWGPPMRGAQPRLVRVDVHRLPAARKASGQCEN